MTDFLQANLAILRERFPDFASFLEAHRDYPRGAEYVIDTSRRFPTIKIGYDGRSHAISSQLDPVAEAKAILDRYSIMFNGDIFLFGFGLGHVVEEIVSRGFDRRLTIAILNPALLWRALGIRDLTKLLVYPALEFLSLEGEIIDGFNRSEASRFENFVINQHEMKIMPANLARLSVELADLFTVKTSALKELSRTVYNNIVANAPLVRTMVPAGRIFGRFNGKPALILSSGRSVDLYADEIRRLSKKMTTFISISLLAGAQAKGIDFDLIFVMDPTKYILTYIPGEPLDIPLVVIPSVRPEVIAAVKGPRIVAFAENDTLRYSNAGIGNGFLGSTIEIGPSVSVAMLNFARRCGFDPILMAGLDLSVVDAVPYQEEAYRQNSFVMPEGDDAYPERLTNTVGAVNPTHKGFLLFRDSIERAIRGAGRTRIFDVNVPGALIRNAVTLGYADGARYADSFPDKDRDLVYRACCVYDDKGWITEK